MENSDYDLRRIQTENGIGVVCDDLRGAYSFATDKGSVASLPQLILSRINSPFGGIVWDDYLSTISEHAVGMTRGGIPVAVVIHGGGLITQSPESQRKYLYELDFMRRIEKGKSDPRYDIVTDNAC